MLAKKRKKQPNIASIPGFPDYYADVDGNIWSYKKPTGVSTSGRYSVMDEWKMGRMRKLNLRVRGNYQVVAIYNEKQKTKCVYVHRLVLLAFRGKDVFNDEDPLAPGLFRERVTVWINGDTLDNRLENLDVGRRVKRDRLRKLGKKFVLPPKQEMSDDLKRAIGVEFFPELSSPPEIEPKKSSKDKMREFYTKHDLDIELQDLDAIDLDEEEIPVSSRTPNPPEGVEVGVCDLYPNYEVWSTGSIYNINTGEEVKQDKFYVHARMPENVMDRYVILIDLNGKLTRVRIESIMMETFPEFKEQVLNEPRVLRKMMVKKHVYKPRQRLPYKPTRKDIIAPDPDTGKPMHNILPPEYRR